MNVIVACATTMYELSIRVDGELSSPIWVRVGEQRMHLEVTGEHVIAELPSDQAFEILISGDMRCQEKTGSLSGVMPAAHHRAAELECRALTDMIFRSSFGHR
jgi:hypothetical protein